MAGWFGELYRETTEPLLGPRLTLLEAEVIASLLGLRPGERVLDAGCGSGRHLRALRGRRLELWGVDADERSLRAAASTPTPTSTPKHGPRRSPFLVRADLRALPFPGVFDAAYAWYSSLFLFDEAGNRNVLAGLGRVLRPGGRLLVQHANPFRLAREPVARTARALPGGGEVEEESRYDPASGVEMLHRTMRRQGRVLAGEVRLRYYRPTEWEALAAGAGLTLRSLGSTGPGAAAPFTEEALDLIAVLEKPT
ncbi:MAG: methyltransferase domain-containing protein [Deltaproteobacteria bacterium]|nr:methyltransferase domain-containing protein [Deltaproteobacteria bacterium]